MSDLNPLVTIVVPIYNVEQYLEQCLESIIGQSYRELEIICVIDGATDGSLTIARRFSEQDDRIIVLQQQNLGLSAARNTGLSLARGEYIFFLDSDDWLKEDAIEALVSRALSVNLPIVSGGVVKYNEDTREVSKYKAERDVGRLNLKGHNLFNLEVMVWNKLYHSSVFKNERFLEGLVHEDEEMYWRIFTKFSEVYAIEQDVIYYRIRKGSITNPKEYDAMYQENFIKIIERAVDICSGNPILMLECKLRAFNYLKAMKKRNINHAKYSKVILDKFGFKTSYLYKKKLKMNRCYNIFMQRICALKEL